MPFFHPLIDLTNDTSSASSPADEVTVNPDPLGPTDNAHDDFRGRAVSLSELDSSKDQISVSRGQSPIKQDVPPLRNPSPPAQAAPRPDLSPAKSARFSVTDEVIQPSPPRPSSSRANTQHLTPQPYPEARQTSVAQTPKKSDWTVDKIAAALTNLADAVEKDHSRAVEYMLEVMEDQATEPRNLSSSDAFAGMKACTLDQGIDEDETTPTMALRIKQHSADYSKTRGAGRKYYFPVTPIKSDQERVPKYRFHHVEVRKNILTPNTMLNFVPHLRDVDPNSTEEKKYNNWLRELEKLDTQSGFKTTARSDKAARRYRDEYAKVLLLYLDRWLKKLNIEGCTTSTLISFMASHSRTDDAITPQQKSDLLDKYAESTMSPQAVRAAKMFTEAFDRVFNSGQKKSVSLRDILMLDKSVETIVDNKRAKDFNSPQKQRDKDLLPRIEDQVSSFTALGCLICFSHDCEHGDLNAENQRGAFSLDLTGGLGLTLKEKWAAQLEEQKKRQESGAPSKPVHPACKNQCYRSYDVGNVAHPVEPWTDSEISVLEQIFASLGHSPTLRAQCFVAAVLGRRCWDVYRKLKELNLQLPDIDIPAEKPKVKAVSWYDRKKKQLFGDWTDAIVTHHHAIREITEPCHHQGPCVKGGKGDRRCPCAEVGLLCERFCHCTAEDCAIKFTGCACRGYGKTCIQRQKDMKPCICLQLNRECDPVLCGCGAHERADPENAYDEHLHSTGCQNVVLQRGAAKTVLLGKSKVPECGYGLFTAEDIAHDDFVIEYTGELITHDEGVRREARRGDVFDQANYSSYLFTLLEHEGIWVDAAIYGNLSRYINHANESDRRACNITPKILYVNGEFRIKFTAIRDIKAGEELFFNYGDYFPNLTKKLLEENEEEQAHDPTGAKRKAKAAQSAARKQAGGKKRRNEGRMLDSDDDIIDWLGMGPQGDEDDDMAGDYEDHTPRKIKKKRGGRRPGAGRKKKVPIEPTMPATINQLNNNPSPAEISDSQGSGMFFTPSRRRVLKRAVSNQTSPESINDASLVRAQLLQDSPSGNYPPHSTPNGMTGAAGLVIKKPSKRGGARPGAGRKPKKPAVAKTDASKDNTTADENNSKPNTAPEDSEDLPLQTTSAASAATRIKLVSSAFAATGNSGGGNSFNDGNGNSPKSGLEVVLTQGGGGSGVGRKRNRAAVVDSEEDVDMDMSGTGNNGWTEGSGSGSALSSTYGGSTGAAAAPTTTAGPGGLPFRQDQFQPMSDVAMDEDDDDDDSVADRSARKRQKPLRYRVEDA